MFSAWFGGARPGLLAIVIAFFGFEYFFLSPLYTLSIETAELPRLLVFALSALFVVGLSAAQKNATESLRRAHYEQQKINEALQAENVERRRAEDALRASEQVARGQIEALAQNLDILATAPAPENLIGQMLSTIGHFLMAQSVVLWLLDEPNDVLVLRAAAEGANFAAADSEHPFIKDPGSWKSASWIQEMFFTGAPTVVEGIETDPRVPEALRDYFRSKGTRKFLGIPTLKGGDVKGFIGIRHGDRTPYRPEEIELAQALAHQAMFAVQLDQFASQAQHAAILEERNRMARDIHDTLAQGFTGVIVQLEAAEDAISCGQEKEADKHLHRAAELARQSLSEARRSVHALRPDALECDNFWDALKGIIKNTTAGTALRTTCELRGKVPELPPNWEENLLHIGQEALTNTLRYAAARSFRARLNCNGKVVRLELRDDGAGFDLTDRNGGFGLTGMRERVEQMGGGLQITTAPGQGTAVVVVLSIPTGKTKLALLSGNR
jgi:signal transduction histidine kinase